MNIGDCENSERRFPTYSPAILPKITTSEMGGARQSLRAAPCQSARSAGKGLLALPAVSNRCAPVATAFAASGTKPVSSATESAPAATGSVSEGAAPLSKNARLAPIATRRVPVNARRVSVGAGSVRHEGKVESDKPKLKFGKQKAEINNTTGQNIFLFSTFRISDFNLAISAFCFLNF